MCTTVNKVASMAKYSKPPKTTKQFTGQPLMKVSTFKTLKIYTPLPPSPFT